MSLPLLSNRENSFLFINDDGSNTVNKGMNEVISVSRGSFQLTGQHSYHILYFNASVAGEVLGPSRDDSFLGYTFSVFNAAQQNVTVKFAGRIIGKNDPEQLLEPGQFATFISGGNRTMGNGEWIAMPGQGVRETGGGGTVDPDSIKLAQHFLEVDKFITLQHMRQYALRRDVRGVRLMPDPEPLTGWDLGEAVIEATNEKGPDDLPGVIKVTNDDYEITMDYPIDKQFIDAGATYLFEAWLKSDLPVIASAGLGIVLDDDPDNATGINELASGEEGWIMGRHYFALTQQEIGQAQKLFLQITLVGAVPFDGVQNTVHVARIAVYDVNDVIQRRLSLEDIRAQNAAQPSVRALSRDDVRDMILYLLERYAQRRPDAAMNMIRDPHTLAGWSAPEDGKLKGINLGDDEKVMGPYEISWVQTAFECTADGPVRLRIDTAERRLPGGNYQFQVTLASTVPGLEVTCNVQVSSTEKVTRKEQAGSYDAANRTASWQTLITPPFKTGVSGVILTLEAEMKTGDRLFVLWPDLVPILEPVDSGGGDEIKLPDLVLQDEKRMRPGYGRDVRSFRPNDVRDMIAFGAQAYSFPRDNLNLSVFKDTTFWSDWTVNFGRFNFVDAPELGPFDSTWVQSRLEGDGDAQTVAGAVFTIPDGLLGIGSFQVTAFVAGGSALVDAAGTMRLYASVPNEDTSLADEVLAENTITLGRIQESDWKNIVISIDVLDERPITLHFQSSARMTNEFAYIVAPRIQQLIPTITDDEKLSTEGGDLVRQWRANDIRDLINIAISRFAQPVPELSPIIFDDPVRFVTWNRNRPDDPQLPAAIADGYWESAPLDLTMGANDSFHFFGESPVDGPTASSYNDVYFAPPTGDFLISKTFPGDSLGTDRPLSKMELWVLLEQPLPEEDGDVIFVFSNKNDYSAASINTLGDPANTTSWQKIELSGLLLAGSPPNHIRIFGRLGVGGKIRIANPLVVPGNI